MRQISVCFQQSELSSMRMHFLRLDFFLFKSSGIKQLPVEGSTDEKVRYRLQRIDHGWMIGPNC